MVYWGYGQGRLLAYEMILKVAGHNMYMKTNIASHIGDIDVTDCSVCNDIEELVHDCADLSFHFRCPQRWLGHCGLYITSLAGGFCVCL